MIRRFDQFGILSLMAVAVLASTGVCQDTASSQVDESAATAVVADVPAGPEMAAVTLDQVALSVRRIHLSLQTMPANESIRSELTDAVSNAAALVRDAGEMGAKLDAYKIWLQAQYMDISRWPHDPKIDHRLSNMRAAVKEVVALGTPEAKAVGDYWNLVIGLFELKRVKEPKTKRRVRMATLLDTYVRDSPTDSLGVNRVAKDTIRWFFPPESADDAAAETDDAVKIPFSFQGKTIGGKHWDSAKYKGHILVIHIDASWVHENSRVMQRLGLFRIRNLRDIRLATFNVDTDRDVMNLTRHQGMFSWPFLPLGEDRSPQIIELLKIQALPTFVVLDREGNVRASTTSVDELNSIVAMID